MITQWSKSTLRIVQPTFSSFDQSFGASPAQGDIAAAYTISEFCQAHRIGRATQTLRLRNSALASS